ncbi:hydroxymethylglutaryl-CoA lyase [Catalinimonas alkaloidigena]|uniref:Hydroxymethylglutaryl-CoA lyase n=1 Tax=Catalinimonas alkaloidigena TaxID=1075417 RepID=A0A1G8XKW0_9BACT|nr:hydroxymethylglutaryl-CoA lyase [Catalinimonas alkaloidigena]SDJ90814.1 hydroxymethylglutaryl-CoA lyase [Catalinimonas alkaloidigena]
MFTSVKIIECPRDAMQGFVQFIPTEVKIAYLNQLLRVGFDTLDCGSFVSPKAVPQMRDTAEVLSGLDLAGTATRLLAIVANLRGAEEALLHPNVSYLGFPLSISETFQQRNTNRSIEEALQLVETLQNLCVKHGRTLVVYLSMGFGNPYGDVYHPELIGNFLTRLAALDIRIVSLADTTGMADAALIRQVVEAVIPAFPQLEIGVHLHTTPAAVEEKIAAAYEAGCRRFDGALGGYGGCPMAREELTGNVPTERLLRWLKAAAVKLPIQEEALSGALQMIPEVFRGGETR